LGFRNEFCGGTIPCASVEKEDIGTKCRWASLFLVVMQANVLFVNFVVVFVSLVEKIERDSLHAWMQMYGC